MKTIKRDLRDSGIRLKPKESNILKNYSKYTKRRKKKKKKKKKKSVKAVQIKPKLDDIDKLLTDQSTRQSTGQSNDIEIIDTDNNMEVETKTIDIVKGKPDISKNDPNIKKVKVDNIDEASDKKGGGILIE